MADSPNKGAPIKEALKALDIGNGDAIVDIKVSKNEAQDSELSKSGYTRLLQETFHPIKRSIVSSSTFGNNISLWIWRRSQGTCSGRLKPIIDIQLDISSTSSDFVLSGYICDPVLIAGQRFWIKSASSEEEEKDAIVDLYVSTGKMKDTSDPIWSSPGIGWVRVDGNFTKSTFGSTDSILWFRPSRTRSIDSHISSPIRSAVGLTEEIRLTRLMAAVRLALRHHIPINDIKRLSNLMTTSDNIQIQGNANQGKSATIVKSIPLPERMMDFTTLYHAYEPKTKLNKSKFGKMLNDIGLRVNSNDVFNCFSFFDVNQTGYIGPGDYAKLLSLTDFELDLAVERIRSKLLMACSKGATNQTSRFANVVSMTASTGAIGTVQSAPPKGIGKNIIREKVSLCHIFKLVNIKDDQILSIEEMLDLSAKIDIFLTEEEAMKLLKEMDVDGDGRVEEGDFVSFLSNEHPVVIKKAHRLHESSMFFRRWLVRGSSEKVTSSNTTTASVYQWKQFQKMHGKITKEKFPGFLTSQLLQLQMSALGLRLSAIEIRELTLLIAPEKNGRIHQSELHLFMGRSCRGIGELAVILERNYFTELFDAYRAHTMAIRTTNKEDFDLADHYRKLLDHYKKEIENVYDKPPPNPAGNTASGGASGHGNNEDEDGNPVPIPVTLLSNDFRIRKFNSYDVISIAQLKDGVEESIKLKKLPDALLLNLEEWACLSCLVNADVAEGDIYGVKPKAFLEGLCSYIMNANEKNRIRAGDRVSLDIVSKILRRQICIEAKASVKGTGRKPDFKDPFDLFDEDKNGKITLEEFRRQLKRFQLIGSLPDHQIPNLLALFDKGKKGYITLPDFVEFAKEGNRDLLRGDYDDDADVKAKEEDIVIEDDDIDDYDGLSSNTPPVVVSNNTDCDWLLWYLYRQCCKLDPLDPETITIELQGRCSDAAYAHQDGFITVKDLYLILGELQINGGLSQAQYIKGIQSLCRNKLGREDDHVDYDTLCKFIIRMGRGYQSILQQQSKSDESKFVPLLADLKKYFKEMSNEKVIDKNGRVSAAKYEKIFRRLDTDGDEMLSPKEFKIGLKRLHYKDEKLWTLRMIKRFFDECDKNKDGSLSITELNNYINQNDARINALPEKAVIHTVSEAKDGAGSVSQKRDSKHSEDDYGLDSDGENEDDDVFRKHKAITDVELIRKINDVLHDVVPMDTTSLSSTSLAIPGNKEKHHTEQVRSSVRRFFQRSDPQFTGHASEERFRAFLRRSGLQDRLTATEIRRLTDKLKKKGFGSDRDNVSIDYEKFCTMLNVTTNSIPMSHSDSMFIRFQDAANASAAAGRPFLGICSLHDLRLVGKISKQDLLQTMKMMDLPATLNDLDALLELLPKTAIDHNHLVDYRILQNLLLNYTPKSFSSGFNHPYDLDFHNKLPGSMLSSVAIPRSSVNFSNTGNFYGANSPAKNSDVFNRSLSTPLGVTMHTPLAYDPQGGASGMMTRSQLGIPIGGSIAGYAMGLQGGGGGYERVLRQLMERAKLGIDEKSRVWGGAAYSLRSQCEMYDRENTGLVSMRLLHNILGEINVILSTSEQHTISAIFGRKEDDMIYYDSFCRTLDNLAKNLPMGAVGGANYSTAIVPTNHDHVNYYRNNHLNSSQWTAAYLTPWVLNRYRELLTERRNLREVFETFDLDRSGLISTYKFGEVVQSLQLLQNEHQLQKALEDFTVISNRSLVCYTDFCWVLEKAESMADNNMNMTRRSGTDNEDYMFDTLTRFRNSMRNNHGNGRYPSDNDIPVELEAGSDYNPLMMPKPSESFNGSMSLTRNRNRGNSSPNRYSAYNNSWNDDNLSLSRSIANPRASPSKVGSKMWGSDTPLSRKGDPLWLDKDTWCCQVCLYVENPKNAPSCVVCDSPNYNIRKDYQIREQCANCTFMNGHLAQECEMCGEPLSRKHHSTMPSTPPSNRSSKRNISRSNF